MARCAASYLSDYEILVYERVLVIFLKYVF